MVVAVLDNDGIVFARLRNPNEVNFGLTSDSELGGVRIEPVLRMPRALYPDGSPRFDLFAFKLENPGDAGRFSVGAIVELTGVHDGAPQPPSSA